MSYQLTAEQNDMLDHIVCGTGDAEVIDVVDVDDECTVVVLRGHPKADFVCVSCEAHGLGDGYAATEDGAREWHAAL